MDLDVEREGYRLHAAVTGRTHAPALLLCNPLGASIDVWKPQLPELERYFRVIRFDVRGHGRSQPEAEEAAADSAQRTPQEAPAPALAAAPAPKRSLSDYGEDALAVLHAAHIERAHWCGLSFGGMTAMWAATTQPRCVGHLVLANTSAYMPPRETWDERIATARSQGMEPLAKAVPERWFTAGFRQREAAAVEATEAMVRATSVAGYVEVCAAIRDMDQRESIAGITAPTLVIAGAQDPSTPVEHGEAIVARIPGADLLVLDAAHLSNVEQPEEFTAALLDFLRD
jgi:3-oxoadipate enol-lactonase